MTKLFLTNTPSGDSTSFPFFKLPRELRDKFYGRVTRKGAIDALFCEERNIFHAGVETAPFLRLLLVSKQFKREYEEEVARSGGTRVANMALYTSASPVFIPVNRSWIPGPRDGTPPQELFRLITDLRVEYDAGELPDPYYNFRNPVRRFISIAPNLQTIKLESTDEVDLYDDFDDYKMRLARVKTDLLRDDNGNDDNGNDDDNDEGNRIRDLIVKGVTTLSCHLVEANANAAAYRQFVRPGYVETGHIEFAVLLHPQNITLVQAQESDGPHTLDGFEIGAHPTFVPLSFEEIEADVLAFLKLYDDPDADELNERVTQAWAAELEEYYEADRHFSGR
ncbi:hypothetical protein AC578_6231 [Pseudocercospora eumusae]|uniref:Uncharacterized protein n=1 Tax=Pseudocercospora eumusae TaxID=321146 RepID=A0A139H338_9PEZI|nr:hypothetical protein AC578_6231 [Pseudocercospora eumusae]